MIDMGAMRAAAAGFQGNDSAEATVNKIMDVQAQQNENESKKIDAGILMHRASIAKFLVKHMNHAPASNTVALQAYVAAVNFLVELMKGEPV
jgi:hypothetical protein